MTETQVDDFSYVERLAARGALPGNHQSAEAAVVAISIGREMNLPAHYSLRMINVNSGRVTIQAQAQLAGALRSCPDLSWDVPESTAKQCTITMQRGPTKPLVTTTYTIQEAKDAGLTNSNTWKRYPVDMLYARCMTRSLRRVVPECGGHDPDELDGGADAPAPSSTATSLDDLIPGKDGK